MEYILGWQLLFFGLFFIASLFDLKYRKVPSIIIAPNLFAFALLGYLQTPIYVVNFLAIFSILWFIVAILTYFTKEIALNFIDILYLSLAMVLVKKTLLFLIIFTFSGYLFWLRYGKKEAPLLPPLFLAMIISLF